MFSVTIRSQFSKIQNVKLIRRFISFKRKNNTRFSGLYIQGGREGGRVAACWAQRLSGWEGVGSVGLLLIDLVGMCLLVVTAHIVGCLKK